MGKRFFAQPTLHLLIMAFAGAVLLSSHVASAQAPYPWKGGTPVSNAGSVGGEFLDFYYLGAAVEYDWAIAPTWTIGGHFSLGSAFVGDFDGHDHDPKAYSRLHFRGRWYFDRGYRARNGFTLRYNSGFFLEPAIGLTQVGRHSFISSPLLSVGYHYVTKSRLSMSAKMGGLFPLYHYGERWGPFYSLELKLGYAF